MFESAIGDILEAAKGLEDKDVNEFASVYLSRSLMGHPEVCDWILMSNLFFFFVLRVWIVSIHLFFC